MKKGFLLSLLIFISISIIAKQRDFDKIPYRDSTLHHRFIMSILKEYELEGRWIFVRVDSVYKLKNNYELIHPGNIYESYNENFREMNKNRFLFMAYESLRQGELFERYPESKHPIRGIKINMKSYNSLKKVPIKKLLETYFDRNKQFKEKYNKSLYEIIAVCYTNNIKVITPEKGTTYYEVFK